MIVLPLLASVIAFACMAMVVLDAVRRPRPDKIAWAVAFGLFGIAAGLEVAGTTVGWTPVMARLYYLAGAILVVGYLALGELYLLAPRQTTRFGPGATLLVTALAATVTFDAPVDASRLASDGWRAIERGPALVAMAVSVNAIGTLVLVVGALWSAWRFRVLGRNRHRMIGCVLIAVGTLVVATGGTLTRLGRPEYLYVAMALGVAVIFAGYLEARRPDAPRVEAPASPQGFDASAPRMPISDPAQVSDPALQFVHEVLALGADACSARCTVWSVEPRALDRFDRETARRAWALRTRLDPPRREQFDAMPVAVQAQIADLYAEVLAPESRVRPVEGLGEHRTGPIAAITR